MYYKDANEELSLKANSLCGGVLSGLISVMTDLTVSIVQYLALDHT